MARTTSNCREAPGMANVCLMCACAALHPRPIDAAIGRRCRISATRYPVTRQFPGGSAATGRVISPDRLGQSRCSGAPVVQLLPTLDLLLRRARLTRKDAAVADNAAARRAHPRPLRPQGRCARPRVEQAR